MTDWMRKKGQPEISCSLVSVLSGIDELFFIVKPLNQIDIQSFGDGEVAAVLDPFQDHFFMQGVRKLHDPLCNVKKRFIAF